LAPIYTFVAQHTPNTYTGMGNLYGVIPFEGRYDALQPTSFVIDKKGNAVITKQESIAIDGEVRDAKWIKLVNGKKALIVARSNDKLLFFETP
jgi:hypothetical protein